MSSRTVIGIAAATLLASCQLFTSVDCGPMDDAACDARVSEIRAVVEREDPGRSIRSIVIVTEDGEATVILDDGTEIGFGVRL